MLTVGVNHRLPILHIPKRMFYFYTTDETINKFAIGYTINSSLKFKNTFRTQAEKSLSISFSTRKMKKIKNSNEEEYASYGTTNDL